MPIDVGSGAAPTAGRVFGNGDVSAARRTEKFRRRLLVEGAWTFSGRAPSISFDLPPVPVDRENAEQPKLATHRDVSATSSGVWFGGGFIV